MNELGLATTLIKAAKIREDSYVSNKELSKCHYGKDIREAVDEADPYDKDTNRIAYILLVLAWNDALEWAEEVIGR